jgi:hypothetical protein
MGFPLLPAAMHWFSYSDLGANCEARKLLAFCAKCRGSLRKRSPAYAPKYPAAVPATRQDEFWSHLGDR